MRSNLLVRWRWPAAIGLVALMLASCMSVPVAETDAMAKATEAVASASDILLGQLNAAEKKNLLYNIPPHPGSFNTDEASLYTTLDAYAPQTAKFKAAITILKAYAGLIKSLVDGSSAAATRAQVDTIVSNLDFILKGATEFKAAYAALSPLFERVQLLRTRAEARALVARGREPVATLIGDLRNATPAMFLLLLSAATTERPIKFDSVKTRAALSDYVILLDRLKTTFDRLADAFASGNSTVTLASLAESTGELSATAKIVQQALAGLR